MKKTHGFARVNQVERLHKIWRKMRDRCKRHPRYAGRGITVCHEWADYVAFRTWAHDNSYAEHLTIERVDNDGNYEPSNCTWVSRGEQTRNRSTSKRITFAGKTQIQNEWARELGIDPSLINYRMKRGWPIERVLTPPVSISYDV